MGLKNAQMIMSYESITPEYAGELLKRNDGNRNLSPKTVNAYATDMINGNWDEVVSSAIAIDYDGNLRDGQHRLSAIVKSGKTVNMWVCKNVDPKGQYDNNRRRSDRDQLAISRPDIENAYRDTKIVGAIRLILTNCAGAQRITISQVIDFIDDNKETLDIFISKFPRRNCAKIYNSPVVAGVLLAFANGVDIDSIIEFYEVLSSGMSISETHFPIIGLRNLLLNSNITGWQAQREIVLRTQYAIKKYISKSCTKKNGVPDELIYPCDAFII